MKFLQKSKQQLKIFSHFQHKEVLFLKHKNLNLPVSVVLIRALSRLQIVGKTTDEEIACLEDITIVVNLNFKYDQAFHINVLCKRIKF